MFRENEEIISKADVLEFLYQHLPEGTVEPVLKVKVGDVLNHPEGEIQRIRQHFPEGRIVARSSSLREDSMESSNAGHFDSVLNLDPADEKTLTEALRHVAESYLEGKKLTDLEADLRQGKENSAYPGFLREVILVQPQTEDVTMAGVIFTRDIRKNRPYFTINYSEDGTTDAVTSGRGGQMLHIARNMNPDLADRPFGSLIRVVNQILSLCSLDNLDIEFGIRKSGEVRIFQCRPLAAVRHIEKTASDEEIFTALGKAHEDYSHIGHVLSDMAFWNPSEIIGDNPFPLDYSLYREIITSYVWSAGIAELGYHFVNADLMYRIGNKPYISVDESFEGLIPESLQPRLQRKLKNYYMKKLIADPSAHDKIEFEIVYSVYDFCTDENLDRLLDDGFTKNEINEIRRSLFSITELAVKSYGDEYAQDMESLRKMRELRHRIRHQGALSETDPEKLTGYVGELLQSIKQDGTPQFSRMARLAFIAKSFTGSLVRKGYVSQEDTDHFYRSINTVASDFERDFDEFTHCQMSEQDFKAKYGHLRLGTYNIRTDCYSEMYFPTGKKEKVISKRTPPFDLPKDAVNRALQDYELDFDADTLLDYVRKTTQNREYFKFEFTKSLSLALNLLIRFGEVTGIPRNDLSYLEIMDFFEIREPEKLKERIRRNRDIHRVNSGLMLPELIFGERDLDEVKEDAARPNFITSKEVTAETALLDDAGADAEIAGKIVVITRADPGYDWIFTRNIAGFISRYGGAASHMAIRCAEFGIAAAIGCGEKIFHDVCGMKKVHLDCRRRTISQGR